MEEAWEKRLRTAGYCSFEHTMRTELPAPSPLASAAWQLDAAEVRRGGEEERGAPPLSGPGRAW
ncbi:hypothetical protein INR49_027706 [Caranx melampygus]|nr:hypothetical protein INR49_027706 [Caranx melampygus]